MTDSGGVPVADAVIVAEPEGGHVPVPERPRTAVVDQVDKEFEPRVTVVQAPTLVTFPNRDNVRHQVYSFSAPRRFELPLYAGTPAEPVLFDTPGVVVLGCNIHDWMIGYIYVADSPYFSKTGADGKASVTLPAGKYRVRLWHSLLVQNESATERPATVDGDTGLSWSVSLRPEQTIRRAPSGDDEGFSY